METNKYLGIIFDVSISSYFQNKEIKNSQIIVWTNTKNISKNIIISPKKYVLNEIKENTFHIHYKKDISLILEKPPIKEIVIIQTKVNNERIFSIKDYISLLKPKEYSDFLKETNIENYPILDNEIKIRMNECIKILNIEKYID